MKRLKTYISLFGSGIGSGYSQVFFSNNKWFALALFLASFTDPSVGISGLSAVIMALVIGRLAGFDTACLVNGTYTFNVLLSGMAMGAYFRLSPVFFGVLFLASLVTLLLSVWLYTAMREKKLPLLSLPFVLGTWIMLLSTRNFAAIGLNERGIYASNELWRYGKGFTDLCLQISDAGLPQLIILYLKSMGAIFFQNTSFAGLLITIGLIAFSRIAFSLSVIGFFSGYFFCALVQGAGDIGYSAIGFNYILTAMAIGGFFLVPSVGSYMLAALSAPLVSLFVSALREVTEGYMLSLYSLPFTMVVLLLVYVLTNRTSVKYVHQVTYQLFSPEKNFYLFHHYTERFKNDGGVEIHLPFYGEWTVSQGHNGAVTHRDDWRFALDFVVKDEDEKTYRMPGQQLSDFYCYQLPVLAPATGHVVEVLDGIEDNAIGDVNLRENWGNTILIKHAEHLYSKLSHLKKDSFKVKAGDLVKQGDLLALCGSSGRSPEPHLHFQLQALPFIGAKTLDHALSYYISRDAEVYKLHTFETPAEGDKIMRPMPTPLMTKAFHFIPGKKLAFDVNDGKKKYLENWEVMTNSSNLSYLYCSRTQSLAYFSDNGTLFYFTSFYGDKTSLLYYFYTGAHKLLLGYFQDIILEDKLPVDHFYKGGIKFLQDLLAPFYVFLKTTYEARYVYADSSQSPSCIRILSTAKAYKASVETRSLEFELEVSQQTIKRFVIKEKTRCLTAKYIG